MDCLNGTTFAGMVTLPYKIKKFYAFHIIR
jgi:hypothetical protein